jgi:hypothetical protein
VCVFWLVNTLFLMDLKTVLPILRACCPEIRITAIAPAPEGVASATIESLGIIFLFQFYTKVTKIAMATSLKLGKQLFFDLVENCTIG